ncbi:MAG: hypothetical protein JWR52_3663 [Marmoricola sp.]|nr:hypothetical protein [Marmoricola sp.]
METSAFRRIASTLTIGSFSVAALMGIAALLGAGSFGTREGQVLLTTLIVGAASICVLCYLGTAGTRWAGFGGTGAVAALVPTVTALILVWGESSADGLFRTFGIGLVVALTLAQVCLLLALAADRPTLGVALWSTVAAAAVLAFLVVTMILGPSSDGGLWRAVGVVGILDVLGTLITIAMAKFGDPARASSVSSRDGTLRVTLSADQARDINNLVRRTGRSADHIVGEAVDRFLHG